MTTANITVKIRFSDLESGVDEFVNDLLAQVKETFAAHAIQDDGDTCQVIVERIPEPSTPPPSTVVTYNVTDTGQVTSRVT